MNVPRNISMPVVISVGVATGSVAMFSFFQSVSELHQLQHLSEANHGGLPNLTEFYSRVHGVVFLLPVLSLAAGIKLLLKRDCTTCALAWLSCLSLVALVLWSLFAYVSIHVGFMRHEYLL